MRVISGTVRGMKLLSPEGTGTRPTLDRVKESVFSILYPYLQEFRVHLIPARLQQMNLAKNTLTGK